MNLYFVLGCAAMGVLITVWLFYDIRRESKRQIRIDEDFTADHWRTPDQETRGQLIQLHAKAGAHQKRAGQQRGNWK